ncbi:ribonuclease H [Halobacteriales archaeon QS_1_68_20]|nr:MAG: ribonuclease H [Halobacteriales archaeon QS_1_68_20]
MAPHGRRTLRDLFDESPTPHIAHPPQTHHRDFYVATDGSYRREGGGLGVVVETRTGERVARAAVPDAAPDNNVAEYRALHLGLDLLAPGVQHHWRGVRARIAGFSAVRAAVVDGDANPAHPLANDPERYAHVNDRPARCVLPDTEPTTAPGTPPPSRANRNAGD